MSHNFSTTLYVIFHGSWAFMERSKNPTGILACAADIPAHTFTAGSWLAETKILRGSHLHLKDAAGRKNEKGQCDRLRNHEKDLIIFPPKKPCPELAYATIHLPMPTKIHAELVVPGTRATIKPAPTKPGHDNMGLVPVFEYEIDPKHPPHLDHRNGETHWFAPAHAPGLATTLHCFAADDSPGIKNGRLDFVEVGRLFGYVVDIKESDPIPIEQRPVYTPGLFGREFEVNTFLHERVRHLRAIGAQMQHRGANSLYSWEPPLLMPGEDGPRAADSSSCGGGGGGS